ncbi:hypothetical protein FH972_019161 [Carpinus fangiana]|uniref:Gnk2-homologous domain-containing protein n=1 Tax=Carpinus fangiana TaxID=176857 RepID=A0A5N6RRJ2_9ROSI|nr:hypothetical protein FH972_019161 [Carpinus fangiana]
MQLTVSIPQNPRWLFLVFIIFFFSPSLSDPETALAGILCGSSKQGTIPDFLPNFIVAMDKVSMEVNESRWAALTITSPAPKIFAYAQCYDFLSHDDCIACHSQSRAELPRCLPAKSARIYLDGCYLRYDNYCFFDEVVDKRRDMMKCGNPGGVTGDQYIGREFKKTVRKIVHNVTKTAVRTMGFAVSAEQGGVEGVYAMAQCWRRLNPDGCNQCLSNAAKKVIMCAPAPEGRVMNAGCFLRYSTDDFFGNGNVTLKATSGKNQLLCFSEWGSTYSYAFTMIVVGILSAIGLTLIALIGALLGYTRITRKKTEGKNNHAEIPIYVDKSNLNFKYEMLEKATDSFDGLRKLGQDKSHISTGVAGTLGYMAPEYLVRGQLTEKADVYAFGVLVLEVVSGRKNSVFSQGSSSVLLSVWRHYKANKITQSVDPALKGIYSEKEASNVLQIGLLCTQASAALRPSMSEVVEMLNNEECVIPSPKQPPFLNASVLSSDDSSTTTYTAM